ncbi:MAG: hypothetical protein WCA37_07800, partial [Terracidiphilus sp.]
LAGARPQVPVFDAGSNSKRPRGTLPAQLVVPTNGEETIQFDDVAAAPQIVQWSFLFNRQGKLVKVTRRRAEGMRTRTAAEGSPVTKTWTVPAESPQ